MKFQVKLRIGLPTKSLHAFSVRLQTSEDLHYALRKWQKAMNTICRWDSMTSGVLNYSLSPKKPSIPYVMVDLERLNGVSVKHAYRTKETACIVLVGTDKHSNRSERLTLDDHYPKVGGRKRCIAFVEFSQRLFSPRSILLPYSPHHMVHWSFWSGTLLKIFFIWAWLNSTSLICGVCEKLSWTCTRLWYG